MFPRSTLWTDFSETVGAMMLMLRLPKFTIFRDVLRLILLKLVNIDKSRKMDTSGVLRTLCAGP